MKSYFYYPTQEQLAKLDQPWICSYSGGKDSTTLVTWMEWLRRKGWVTTDKPRLVMSDTEVEFPFLQETSLEMINILRQSGWECKIVKPKTREKLYCQILGRGLPPVHPGMKNMRWCTRATKIDPMKRWKAEHGNLLQLTGLRFGESKVRDGKIFKGGCSAGNECGIPESDDRTYSPIINWSLHQVIEWLMGMVDQETSSMMKDVFSVTAKLCKIYKVKVNKSSFSWSLPTISSLRFGCIGCPAIQKDKVILANEVENPHMRHLKNIQIVWNRARLEKNRLKRIKDGKSQLGPIKMSARKELFESVMKIQQRSGTILMTEKDIEFIKECWKNEVYPRGWSKENEVLK